MSGSLVAMGVLGEAALALLMLGLALISWLDDRHNVPIPLRFAMQSTAAIIWVGCFGVTVWSAAVVLSLVWMTNLYNFMDGSDGLAGGMTVFGFGSYSAAAWFGGDISLSVTGAAIAAAALGFLRFNFPPARIFMGDAGSVPLGFAAGALGYQGWAQTLWPWWFPLLVFSPFIVDATVTLLRRGLRGERVWRAHREHYYQRLVRLGWGHRKTALAEYGLMLWVALSALALVRLSPGAQLLGLFGWAGIYALLAWRIDRVWLIGRQQ